MMKRFIQWIKALFGEWEAARKRREFRSFVESVIREIENDPKHKAVMEREGGNISFCPRCGQKPVSDYRKEEAFQRVYEKFPDKKRSEINYAIEAAVQGVR